MMISFLKRTSHFLILFIFISLIFYLFTQWGVRKKAFYPIDSNIKWVVFGNSYAECAFNDTLLVNLKNLAYSAEAYFYTYQKLKTILSLYPELEGVFIEFSNNQITASMDKWIWEHRYMAKQLPIHSPFMGFRDHGLLLHSNLNDYLQCLGFSFRKNLMRLATFDFNFEDSFGGHRHLRYSQIDSLLEVNMSNSKIQHPKPPILSTKSLEYLRKILDYCRQKNKKVYLVRSPKHSQFSEELSEEIFWNTKKRFFPEVELLDFRDLPFLNEEFGDLEHLNFKGSTIFSAWLHEVLKAGLLKSSNKKQFIQSHRNELARMRISQVSGNIQQE